MTAHATDTETSIRLLMLTAIGGLGITQIIGWGTTFSSLTMFGSTISVDLRLSREVVFGGITMMLLVSALLAPRVGRMVDAKGARPIMIAGSAMAGLDGADALLETDAGTVRVPLEGIERARLVPKIEWRKGR